MPGLVPGIHVFRDGPVDGRVKPGHDEKEIETVAARTNRLSVFRHREGFELQEHAA